MVLTMRSASIWISAGSTTGTIQKMVSQTANDSVADGGTNQNFCESEADEITSVKSLQKGEGSASYQ